VVADVRLGEAVIGALCRTADQRRLWVKGIVGEAQQQVARLAVMTGTTAAGFPVVRAESVRTPRRGGQISAGNGRSAEKIVLKHIRHQTCAAPVGGKQMQCCEPSCGPAAQRCSR